MIEMRMMWFWVLFVLVTECYGCLEQERIALLQLKASINNPYGDSLPTWEEAFVGGKVTPDCCEWERVECNPKTGRVIQLSLNSQRAMDLHWYLNASMFLPFEELESLNLSWNFLVGCLEKEGFEKLAMLSSLENLDLSDNNFNNSILSTLGGLTSLKSLYLGYNGLMGTFHVDDLKHLKNLEKLDIGNNELDSFVTHSGFQRVSVLGKIKVLDLEFNLFNSSILPSLGVLSSLKTINLRNNNMSGSLHRGGLEGLKNLEYLYLDYSSIDSSFLYNVGVMSSLRVLSLRSAMHNASLPDRGWCELPYLQGLDLSENDLKGSLPSCVGNLTSIRLLDLSYNQLHGNLTSSPLINLAELEYLFISHNHLEIPISLVSFYNQSKLKVLIGDNNRLSDQIEFQRSIPRFQLQVFSLSSCSSNKLGMQVPQFLYYQYDLRMVDLSHHSLAGTFPVWLLENNTRLEVYRLRNSSLIGHFLLPSRPNPHLRSIDLSDNHFEGQLPRNISFISPNLLDLNMSTNRFEGAIPTSFGGLDSLKYLDLSNNNLSGQIPEQFPMGCSSLKLLQISNNNLSGQISPSISNLTELSWLFLDNNLFVGELPDSLCTLSNLELMDISNNQFSGRLPRLAGNMSGLRHVVMFSNHFEGPIPVEFCKLDILEFLDLSENNISGAIPSCFNPSTIKHVHLNRNGLRGSLSRAFYNSSSLVSLDLSNNFLSGKIPHWIGSLSVLSILLLKSNDFEGEIPVQICQLKKLSMLDLSQNTFSGRIPTCLHDISSDSSYWKSYLIPACQHDISSDSSYWKSYSTPTFKSTVDYSPWNSVKGSNFLGPHEYQINLVYVQQQTVFTTKHGSHSYKGNILDYMSGVDLSWNLLTGEIPPGIGNLSEIRALNLSHNNISGSIPATFSGLKQIESLDLSYNSLRGGIPPQLIELGSLAVFSVAHNDLSGTTPDQKAQFATFEASSYEGNPLLCGPPLPKSCTQNVPTPTRQKDLDRQGEDGGFLDTEAFYVSFSVSYIIILLSFAAILFINPYWRQGWFYLIEVCLFSCYYFVIDNFTLLFKGRRV
ncbi:cuscuta receptor 1-like [Rhododendron vialii]|uniref:cuscuta receptor 1-like n=1 Tax=Rhododendron vialii TaxID=182163 RepID=UPI00265FEA43|nr:cuscuta receptor 1-like [Rhododendron vialii]